MLEAGRLYLKPVVIESRECSGYIHIHYSHALRILQTESKHDCTLFKTLQTVFVQKTYQLRFLCDLV